jgi:predicted Zn-ribbon and HTH transcriptional regulator
VSRARTPLEDLSKIAGFCPVRCRDCGHRYTKALLWLDDFWNARCPKCYRTELSDWEEPYYYPPRYLRLLLRIGAKGHRCKKCRYNFVSFMNRKKPAVPDWKSAASTGTGGSEAA